MKVAVCCTAAAILGACNQVLDLAPGTLASARPSCEAGWQYRVPIDVLNAASAALSDYQLLIPLPARTAIVDGKLSDVDLRFTTDGYDEPLRYVVEGPLDAPVAKVWVAAPSLAVGTTRLYAYYGNPMAPAWDGASPFVTGVLADPSFEHGGAWTVDPSPLGAVFQRSASWTTNGDLALAADAEVGNNGAHDSLEATIRQQVDFPQGSEYVIRFDLNVVAASYNNNNGRFFVELGNGLDSLWSLEAVHSITGEYRGIETRPFGGGSVPLTFGVGVWRGLGAGYAKGYFDHLRIRKHVSPEPTVRVGAEESACK